MIAETKKSRQVAGVIEDMLTDVSPLVSMGRDTTLLREILDKIAERIGKDFKHQPEVEADLRSVVGYGYVCLYRCTESEVMFRESLRPNRALFGPEHSKFADVLEGLAEAEATQREVAAVRRKHGGASDPALARSLQNLAWTLCEKHDYLGAEKIAREVLAANRAAYGTEHCEVARSLNVLGQFASIRGDREAAEALLREALAMLRKSREKTAWTSPGCSSKPQRP